MGGQTRAIERERPRPGRPGARRRIGPLPALLAALSLSPGLLSCSGEPPEIVRVFWQTNLVEAREQNLSYLCLSLFIKPNDPDGFEDIEEVFLINDEQELLWSLDAETWSQSGSAQDIWIGANTLRMPDGASFPAGEYRILLRDAGGDAAEQTIRLETIPLKEALKLRPAVTVGRQQIEISGAPASYTLWLYDTNGRHLSAYPAGRGVTAIEAILKAQPALQAGFSFRVYAFFEKRRLGVISGPYYVAPLTGKPSAAAAEDSGY